MGAGFGAVGTSVGALFVGAGVGVGTGIIAVGVGVDIGAGVGEGAGDAVVSAMPREARVSLGVGAVVGAGFGVASVQAATSVVRITMSARIYRTFTRPFLSVAEVGCRGFIPSRPLASVPT